MEASAMTGDGVEELFLKCARSILTKVETGKKKKKSRRKKEAAITFDRLQIGKMCTFLFY